MNQQLQVTTKLILWGALNTCALFIFISTSFADSDTGGADIANKIGQHRPFRIPLEKGPKSVGMGKISGRCTVLAGDRNLIPGPCLSVLLILLDTGGKEICRARTSGAGIFEFSNLQGDQFQIVSGSRFYEVVSPLGPIRKGRPIDLKLKQL